MPGIAIAPIPYPDALTNKAWQKSKGALGKLKKTGLGDLLKTAEALHKKLDFNALNPRFANPNTQAQLDKAVADCKDLFKNSFKPFCDHLDKVAIHATKVEKDNSALLKAEKTKNGIYEVIKAAKSLKVTINSLDLDTPRKELQDRIDVKQKLAKKHFDESLKKFVTGYKAFKADPSPASWEKNIKQQGRSVSNSVATLEDYRAKFWSDFQKFQGFDEATLKLDKSDPEQFKKLGLELATRAVEQVAKIAAFKPKD